MVAYTGTGLKVVTMANSPDSNDVVILGAARTPQGRINGQLSSLTAVDLGAHAIRAALESSGVDAGDVEAVIMGQVLQAGAGQNPARQSAVGAGIGWNVPSVTVNKVCLSGLTAVIDAARMIRAGEAAVVVAGGQESMSRAPHLLPGSRQGWTYGSIQALDAAAHDGLTDAFDGQSMGLSTETRNLTLGIDRTSQDNVAAQSHQRAALAAKNGTFDGEIAPISVKQRKGEPLVVDTDEGVRPNTSVESLAGLRAAFVTDGTITAGNSSPLSDGAAALVLASRGYAEEHGLEFLAVVGKPGRWPAPTTPCIPSRQTPSRTPWARPGGALQTSISSRSTRRSAPWPCSPSRTWTTPWRSATSTAVPSPWGTLSGHRGHGLRPMPPMS